MSDLDKYAQMAADMAAPDFLLRLVQERDGLHALIAKWRERSKHSVNRVFPQDELLACANELEAVIAALADQS